MSLEGRRVLILENDYLIALDLQRMVEEAGAGEGLILRFEATGSVDWDTISGSRAIHRPPCAAATPAAPGVRGGADPPDVEVHERPACRNDGRTAAPDDAAFALAIIDIAQFGDDIPDIAKHLMRAGIPIAFGSSYSEFSRGHPAAPHVPVIMKPYGEHEVREILSSLARQHL